jgi:Trk K+ transport system NAD-binding subunit
VIGAAQSSRSPSSLPGVSVASPGSPRSSPAIPRRLQRWARAMARYLRILVRQFWLQSLIIVSSLGLGALLFHRCPIDALGRRPDWSESLFATYSLFAMQPAYPLPADWALRGVYFVYPLLGLLVVADTVVRVALLLFSRQENQKEWTKVLASTYRDHIILCGLGRVGYRILERLIGWHLDVVVIEKDSSSPFIQRVQGLKVPLLLLDARQEESLQVAGIAHAHTLIIATNDDLGNVEIALDGRRLNPEVRVVLRMFDDTIASKLADAFKLDVAFSSAAVAAPLVAASVLDLEIVGSFALEGRELFTAKVHVPAQSPLIGRTLDQVAAEHRLMILSRKPQGGTMQFNPVGGEAIKAEDCIVIHGELAELRAFTKLVKKFR